MEIKSRLRDIMESVIEIKGTEGLTVLTETMKTTLTSGVDELSQELALLAFEYFKIHDFDATPQIVEAMRKVVAVALEKGAA